MIIIYILHGGKTSMLAVEQSSGSSRLWAESASLNCLMNALLRECPDWQFVGAKGGTAGEFRLSLNDGSVLGIAVHHRSRAGRHGLSGPCQLCLGDGRRRPLELTEAVFLVLEALGVDESARGAMLARVRQSCDNIAANLETRACDLDALALQPLGFIEAEAGLLIGHSVHPCPKARDHFVGDDATRYAPEYGNDFPLLWLAAKREHLRYFSAKGFFHRDMVADLAASDSRVAAWLAALNDDEELVPCHPFQWRHWQNHPVIAERLADRSLRLLGEGEQCWRATSSLRAVHCEQAPWMLKFSLSVKLTNSLRHLQTEELARGAQLAEVLASATGGDFQSALPQMQILLEPVALCLLDNAGEPIIETGLLWRANPFIGNVAEHTEVLATLLQDDPRSGVSRLASRLRATANLTAPKIKCWFERYLQVAVRPLLLAQADFGILFGAHQQNIVLQLEDGIWPQKMYFRDCQGTGFSALGAERLGEVFARWGEQEALVIDESMTLTLFCYYLFINASFNVISSLAMAGPVPESELIDQLRAFLEEIKSGGVRDDSVIRHLLESPALKIKANFHCALSDLNENTHADILSLYRPIPNPLTMKAY